MYSCCTKDLVIRARSLQLPAANNCAWMCCPEMAFFSHHWPEHNSGESSSALLRLWCHRCGSVIIIIFFYAQWCKMPKG